MSNLITNRRASDIGPRINFLTKFDPQGTNLNQLVAALANEDASELIYSGQVISLRKPSGSDTYGYTRGVASDSKLPVYFAYNDQLDSDVVEAGGLTGYPCTEVLEFYTPWFKAGDTYTLGAPLTYDADTGNVKVASTVGDVIIGYVSGDEDGPTNLFGSTNECDPVITVAGSVPSQTVTKEILVLRMRTVGAPGIKVTPAEIPAVPEEPRPPDAPPPTEPPAEIPPA